MSNIETKTIASTERVHSSRNGNPRFRVTFTDGTKALTKADASIAYAIENREFRNEAAAFYFDARGQITFAETLTGQHHA